VSATLASAPRLAEAGRFARHVARLAIASLYAELALYPKPGLVSMHDNGSHRDMDAATFMRSLFALRHYFRLICLAGGAGAPFGTLKRLGIEAERRMLRATGGVNTHRGAIFSLGLLCAAAGRASAHGGDLTAAALQAHLLAGWGQALDGHTAAIGQRSHGLAAAARSGAGGARQEAAAGLPSVFRTGLGALRASLRDGRSPRQARIDALFALMVQVSDTNVVHRGGPQGAAFVRIQASAFRRAGGTASPGWEAHALALHHAFIERNLSPGGAADLLAASCFVHALSVEHER
jgi:triphosphoribosyl-dephospho-CoA synthase